MDVSRLKWLSGCTGNVFICVTIEYQHVIMWCWHCICLVVLAGRASVAAAVLLDARWP